MVDEVSPWSSRSAIVIAEKASSVNFTFGFLTVAFAAALVRGHLGAETSGGRIAVDIFCGVFLLGIVSGWVYMRSHPGRIGVSSDEIRQWHRGAATAVGIARTDGDLYIRSSGGKHPQPYLRATGSDTALLLTMYNQKEVIDACVACGWRFAE
jgi:hypothetical protein